jgi:archaellin
VSNAVAGEPVDLTPPYTEGGSGTDPDISSGAEYKTVISYTDINQHMADVPWTVSWVGNSNGDSLLEEGEKAEITAWLLTRATGTAITDAASTGYWVADANGSHGILSTGTLIGTNDQFTLEMAPESGAVLTIQRTAPSRLDTIMDLK